VLALVPGYGYSDRMTLNEGIARSRAVAGLSRSEVARRLGITVRRWWRMETGRLRILAVEMPRIAWALETTISDLYGSTPATATAPEPLEDPPVVQRGEERDLNEVVAELRVVIGRLAPVVLELAETEMRRRG
jgi:transcriptional regulator with XRE-family HTH domain